MHSHTQCHVHGILFPVLKHDIISDLRSPRGSHWFLTGVKHLGMCLIYIEETPCKYLSLKLLDRKDEIPYQNGGQTDTQTDTQTDRQTDRICGILRCLRT